MNWILDMDIPKLPKGIRHQDGIVMMGSCFTTNMGKKLDELFFDCTYNPTGIIFDPLSIARHLSFALKKHNIEKADLNVNGELYSHWDFHSSFSALDPSQVVHQINSSIESIGNALHQAEWLFLTFGTSYVYELDGHRPVSNCHRFPAKSFVKRMLEVDEMQRAMEEAFQGLKEHNPDVKIVLTVSPVRHAKDGILQNSRSKARLVELCLQLEKLEQVHYFPSYELQMDVLRDYRFYDADLVHPNHAATQYIFERFCSSCMDQELIDHLPKLQRLADAYKHKPRFPKSDAHQKFLSEIETQKLGLIADMPWLKKRLE